MKRLLPFVLVLGLAAPASANGGGGAEEDTPGFFRFECPAQPAAEPTRCRPGRTVGAALGLTVSLAALGTGAALTAYGYGDNVPSGQERQYRGWGIGLSSAGLVGMITSSMAIRRNRQARADGDCGAGSFNKKKVAIRALKAAAAKKAAEEAEEAEEDVAEQAEE